ncbi:MAG: hypothetical protein GY804_04920 [Alphaproteobacteria bacterium]|nr:hypothetical protein [Alphaproteobacteria bacterium]
MSKLVAYLSAALLFFGAQNAWAEDAYTIDSKTTNMGYAMVYNLATDSAKMCQMILTNASMLGEELRVVRIRAQGEDYAINDFQIPEDEVDSYCMLSNDGEMKIMYVMGDSSIDF